MKNRSFAAIALDSNFGAQLSGAALQNGFGEPFWRTGLQNRSFGATALENSFGAQLWGASVSLGSSFGQLSGPALRQLRGTAQLLGRTTALESSFRKQLWEAAFGNNFRGQLGGAAVWSSCRS